MPDDGVENGNEDWDIKGVTRADEVESSRLQRTFVHYKKSFARKAWRFSLKGFLLLHWRSEV